MKKFVPLILTAILVFTLAACGENQTQSKIDVPDSMSKVSISFHSMGQITEWELDENKLSALQEWVNNLSLENLTEKEIKELNATDGGSAYEFNINDGEISFTYLSHGSQKYVVFDDTWYRVLNAVDPDVELAE